MQDSSEFQYIAIDQLFESTTNPRQTFDQTKLEELAASSRQHGLIQPIVIRPKDNRFEIVAGARRYRAGLIAEKFSLPARIKELTDAQAIEWQLIENSQRVDVHPYEEAQGFQRLLELPGYDVAALVEKSGKSASHIYARLSLLQLVPEVARAFVEERITTSHANLIARLPQEHQSEAFENCWRKDWQDKEAHLLPAKHLGAWIQNHLYLNLADAPFDREDASLQPAAGACVTCPRRSGYNTSLFADVQGDQCLDGACYQSKVAAHIEHTLAARPELVTIETTWRNPQVQHPGALPKSQYRELPEPDNPDAEPPCPSAKPALIVFGKNVGRTVTVCLNAECPVHTDHVRRESVEPPPALPPGPTEETEEEAAIRIAAHEQQVAEYEAERLRKEEVREREEKEREAERERRLEQQKARTALFEQVLSGASGFFNAEQMRLYLRLVILMALYGYLEEVAAHFASSGKDEVERDEEDVVLAALDATPDEQLTGFALRLVLSDHVGTLPREGDMDWLSEAARVFVPEPAPVVNRKPVSKAKAAPVKSVKKKGTAKAA